MRWSLWWRCTIMRRRKQWRRQSNAVRHRWKLHKFLEDKISPLMTTPSSGNRQFGGSSDNYLSTSRRRTYKCRALGKKNIHDQFGGSPAKYSTTSRRGKDKCLTFGENSSQMFAHADVDCTVNSVAAHNFSETGINQLHSWTFDNVATNWSVLFRQTSYKMKHVTITMILEIKSSQSSECMKTHHLQRRLVTNHRQTKWCSEFFGDNVESDDIFSEKGYHN